ncbi:HisA/HisF-related TIM barrel protein, partial [Pseudomonas aeruginosa]|uniref:HisA/HisF-related TIM barrel protein n=1 Tax=Pseudomonas aeruginosa TaxID=287 RepID=UPI00338D414F
MTARGWTREGGKVLDVLARLEDAGCRRYVVTDVASDGMLTGPNYELLGRICARTQGKVVASGGIATL